MRPVWGGHTCPPPLKLRLQLLWTLKYENQSQKRRTVVSAPHSLIRHTKIDAALVVGLGRGIDVKP
jgi:hypothetical protein